MRVFYSLDSRLRGNDNNAHACATRWNKQAAGIHGDFAIGNILMELEHCD
jgi:aminoglycoside phosphotransferase (APT) family kinase protein